MTDLVVVGAGPFGLTVARVMAEQGRRVALVERRAHVGGNAFSEPDETTGIEVHRYGAHIFHTSNQRVWGFLGRFTGWTPYLHRVFTVHSGEVFPLPVNLGTINQFFRTALSPDEARALIRSQASSPAPDAVPLSPSPAADAVPLSPSPAADAVPPGPGPASDVVPPDPGPASDVVSPGPGPASDVVPPGPSPASPANSGQESLSPSSSAPATPASPGPAPPSSAGAASDSSPAAALADGGESLDVKAVGMIGRPLYEAFIREYTAKQWQVAPELLPGAVISRLPVRYNYDARYFSDPYQGLPVDGYAALWEKLADHPQIEVRLGEDFLADTPDGGLYTKANCVGQVPVVFTGPIDRYFDYVCGELGWRTLDFVWDHPATGDFQGCPVMNYADLAQPWTRIIEFKHFHPERDYPADRTVIAREFSRLAAMGDEPYYPVATPQDRARLERYREAAKAEPNVVFGGRLGRYQYLDMDMAIAAGLTTAAGL